MEGVTVHYMQIGFIACMSLEMPPSKWPEGQRWSSDWDEVTCPKCREGKQPIDTFTLAADGKSITCKRCKRTSYSLEDVQRRYCGSCHVYHEDLWPPCRAWWITS